MLRRYSTILGIFTLILCLNSIAYYPIMKGIELIPIKKEETDQPVSLAINSALEETYIEKGFSPQEDIIVTPGTYKTKGFFTQDKFVNLDSNGYVFEWEEYDNVKDAAADFVYARFIQHNKTSNPNVFWHPLDTYGQLRSSTLINGQNINSTVFSPAYSVDTYIQGKVFFRVLSDVNPSSYNYWRLRITLAVFNPANGQTTYITSTSLRVDDGPYQLVATLPSTILIPAGYRLRTTYEGRLSSSSYRSGTPNSVEIRTGNYKYNYDWTINDVNTTYNNFYHLQDYVESLGMQLYMYQPHPNIEVSGFTNNTRYPVAKNATITTSPETIESKYKWDGEPYEIFNSPIIISLPTVYGWHILTIEAKDFFDNIAKLVYTIAYDPFEYNVILNSPTNNSLVTDGMVLNFSIFNSIYATYEWDKDTVQFLFQSPYALLLNKGFNGIHQLTVRNTDEYGTHSYEFFFDFDNAAPIITLINVVNETTQAQGKNIDVEITDKSYPIAVMYKWDNNDFIPWNPIEGNLYRTYLPAVEGWHYLTITANDTFGYLSTKVYALNCSLTLLNVDLLNMVNSSYYYGGNTIEITVVNHNDTLKYFWGNDPWNNGTVVENVLTLSGVDALSLIPGTYQLTIIVGNFLNEQIQFIFIFVVDQEKPVIVQTNPFPDYNSTRFLDTTVFSFTISDNLTSINQLVVLYSINGALNKTFLSPFNLYLNSLGDGHHNLTIIAIDIAGNAYRYFITFIIDTTKPSTAVNIVGQVIASDGFRYIPANTMVLVEVSDDDPNTYSYYRWNSTNYILFTHNFTLPAIEGYAQLDVKANDSLGNFRELTYYLTIDASAPTITLFLLSNNSKINAITPIRFKIDDIKANTIEYFTYKWDLEEEPSIPTSTEFLVSLNILHMSETQAEITLYARDLVGNEYTCLYRFILDFNPPSYELLGTLNNTYVRGGSLLDFNVLSTDLLYFYYKWDDDLEYNSLLDPWDIVIPILDGNHTLYIRLEDDTGEGIYTNFIEATFIFIVDDIEIIYLEPFDFTTNYYYIMKYGDTFTFSVNIRDALNKTEIPGLLIEYFKNEGINLSVDLYQPNATIYEFTVYATNITSGVFTSIEFQFYQFDGNRQSVIVYFLIHRQEGTLTIIDSSLNVIYEENITVTFQLKDNLNVSGQEIINLKINGFSQSNWILIDSMNCIYQIIFNSADFFTSKGFKVFSFYVESSFYFGVRNETGSVNLTILPVPIILSVNVNNLEIIYDSDLVVIAILTRQDSTPITFVQITFSFTIHFTNDSILVLNFTTTTNTEGLATMNFKVAKGMEYIIVQVYYNGSNIYDPIDKLFDSNIFVVSGGLSLQIILIIVAAAVLFSIIMGFVIYRVVRARPFEELMEGVTEEEIADNKVKMSPGVILSIFDQMKGPIPLVGNHSLDEPIYQTRMRIGTENFLLKICDQAYSSLGFEEHDVRRRIGSINLPNEDMIGFIHGIQLENKLVRGGFENLSLIVLANSEVGGFLLANQEFIFPEIDELTIALKEKKNLTEIEVLLDAIRRRSVIIMVATQKNTKEDKKEKQKYT